MLRSLSSGISGMRNHQTRMDVIADNIANVNTASFKYSRVIFKDVLSQSIRGSSSSSVGAGSVNPSQVGMGVTVGSIDRVFTQGISDPTSRSTDLTISGNGFFVVADHLGDAPKIGDITVDDLYLTREGAFYINNDGYLVNSIGQYVLGIRSAINGGDKEVTPINLKDINLDGTWENEYIESVSFDRDGMLTINGKGTFDDKYKLYVGVFQHENPESLVRVGNNLYECPVEQISGILDADAPSVAAKATFNVTEIPDDGNILTIGNYKIAFNSLEESIEGADVTIITTGLDGSKPADLVKIAEAIRALNIEGIALGGEGAAITVAAQETGKQGNDIGIYADAFTITGESRLSGGADGTVAKQTFKVTGVPADNATLTIDGKVIGFKDGGVDGDVLGADKVIDTHGKDAAAIANAIRALNIFDNVELSGTGATITVTAKDVGMDGNGIQISASDYSNYSIGGATNLSGGANPTMAKTTFEVTYVPADDTALTINGKVVRFVDSDRAVGADELKVVTAGLDAAGVAAAIRELNIDGVVLSGTGDDEDVTVTVTAEDVTGLANFGNDILVNAAAHNAFGITKQTTLTGGVDSVPSKNINESSGLNFGGMSGCGDIFSGNLEASNVDLSLEFSNMIITQRGYQANARVITVSDSMLQELVDLKR